MTVLTKKKVLNVIKLLEEMYPEAGSELKYDSIFQLLVAVVLSAQATDKSVNSSNKRIICKIS
ncbi:MAG: hypothetical protein ACOX4V_08520 [Anaerovoracaceae bacterium]